MQDTVHREKRSCRLKQSLLVFIIFNLPYIKHIKNLNKNRKEFSVKNFLDRYVISKSSYLNMTYFSVISVNCTLTFIIEPIFYYIDS